MDDTEQCLFCDARFPVGAGSPEHVFLSSIGGRVVTKHAICAACNNAFSSSETDNSDQALRSLLLHACNALNISSGRRGLPPTIERAYEARPGVYFDLAPGLAPIARRAVIPKSGDLTVGSIHNVIASSAADGKRVLNVLRLRGIEAEIVKPTMVSEILPTFSIPMQFNVQSVARCVAKTAVVAASVIYGNQAANQYIQSGLRLGARSAASDMRPFVAFGYQAPWVRLENLRAHPDTPTAETSGFEHSVALTDVGMRWIAFVEFFGAYRFTVDLGPKSSLPPSALIVNPRAYTRSVLQADVVAPHEYFHPTSALSEQGIAAASDIRRATLRAFDDCYKSGRAAKAEQLGEDLMDMLDAAGESAEMRDAALAAWATKLATLESGGKWHEAIDGFLD